MALIDIHGLYFPPISLAGNAFTSTTGIIDATGERYAWIGRVRWVDKSVATRDIRRARFLFGPVTKAGGSALTFSLQNIDTANGPPARPDGTPDQTVAIANADANFAANTYYTTGNLSADRTVAYGELICAVLEYDGSGRLGSDSVAIYHGSNSIFVEGTALFTASWAANSGLNGIVFEFADGTVGVLDAAGPISSPTVSLNVNTGSTPDEVALKFTPDFACSVNRIWANPATAGATADFELILYQGTTALQTVAVDANTLKATGAANVVEVAIPETALTAGTAYYVALRPTTANNIGVRYMDVATPAIRACLPGGTQCSYGARTDAGAWTDTATRYPFIGVHISKIDNGAGAGGGLLRHPGMTGGFGA